MMTNLLNGAHVANKLFSTIARLRLLLVMFLTLTVTANAWGTEYTLVTNVSDLSNGDKVIIATKNNNNPSTGVTGGTVQASTSTNKDATTSSTEADWMQFTVTTTTEGWYLSNTSSQYIGKPTNNTFYLTTATNCKGVCSVNNNGVLCCNSRYLQKNSSFYRMYSGINNSYTPFYVWKVSASYTITAKSNNSTYGTVSLSGTTITATPNAGYRVKSGDAGYSIAAGSATVINNGDNTFSVTPSTDCTITINFEVIPTFTVNWYVNGIRTYSQTDVAGMLLTNIPNLEDYECGDKVFVGWTTQSSYEHANDAPAGMITNTFGITMPEGGENYYAVFAEGSGDAVETSIAGGDWSNGATSEWTTHDKNTYINNGVKFDSTSDYVLSPNIATSGYTELLLKFKAGYNGSQGSVLTIYAYDEEIVLLSDDQVTISPSTVTPDVEYTDQTKTYQVSISAKKTIGKIMIQMTSRTSNLGMKYCELFAISSQHQNYTTQCSNKPSRYLTPKH